MITNEYLHERINSIDPVDNDSYVFIYGTKLRDICLELLELRQIISSKNWQYIHPPKTSKQEE
jgi:hypothetical protein